MDTHRQRLANIRLHLAALGAPVDDCTDSEIEQGVLALGRALADFGLSTAEAAAALRLPDVSQMSGAPDADRRDNCGQSQNST